eukprot:TRINITY_DN6919_c0_g1_i2.p1 TRINITY_DN6919_c0_g1~~TRINITY_DN6919_c0_g1_i2.p1  ORF type:complete len:1078 (+),score=192.06 TRINITY_DN6919_c0_g1_i2:298-3531(+)
MQAVDLGPGKLVIAVYGSESGPAGKDGQYNCAQLVGGEVKCWGANTNGQLGLGDTASRGDNPNEMGDALPAVDVGAAVVQISPGDTFACAVVVSGAVRCWGSNDHGQLGVGDTDARGDGPGEMGSMLTNVDLGGDEVAEVSAGAQFVCARTVAGAVKCWGANGDGQLGYGDTVSRGSSLSQLGANLPAVDLGGPVTAIDAGDVFVCAMMAAGGVKCWGGNAAGQLGLGDSQGRGGAAGQMGSNLPEVQLGTGLTVSAITTGEAFACATFTGGTLKCWGDNGGGRLGLGRAGNVGTAPGEMGDALPAVSLGGSVEVARAGGHSACAVLSGGRLKCWGENVNGQLGLGDTLSRGTSAAHMGNSLPDVFIGACREAPTASPSAGPTGTPIAPTSTPSTPPTIQPSASPSAAPTASPDTSAPSRAPSGSPSARPTTPPSGRPSLPPSVGPSVSPSRTPTAAPSAEPAAAPTAAPSAEPTAAPTAAPTVAPTTAPLMPTMAPTAAPTTAPSPTPTSPSPPPPAPPPPPPPSPPPLTIGPSLPPTRSPFPPPPEPPPLPPPPSPPPPDLPTIPALDTVGSAGGTAVAVAGVAGTAAAAQAAQLAILSDTTCRAEGTMEGMPWQLHPTRITIGGSLYAGAAVMNIAVAAAAAALWVFFLWLLPRLPVKKLRNHPDPQGLLMCPSGLIFLFFFLYQGSVFSAFRVAVHPASTLQRVIGYTVLLVCVAIPFKVGRDAIRGVRGRKARVRRDWERKSPLLVWFVGAGEWVSRTRTDHWVSRYQHVVRPYKADRPWAITVDFGSMVLLGAANAPHTPTMRDCALVRLSSGTVLLIQAVIVIALRPYLRPRDNPTDAARLCLQSAALFIASVGFFLEREDWGGFAAAAHLLTASLVFVVFKVVSDVGAWLWTVCTGRRVQLQLLEWGEEENRDSDLHKKCDALEEVLRKDPLPVAPRKLDDEPVSVPSTPTVHSADAGSCAVAAAVASVAVGASTMARGRKQRRRGSVQSPPSPPRSRVPPALRAMEPLPLMLDVRPPPESCSPPCPPPFSVPPTFAPWTLPPPSSRGPAPHSRHGRTPLALRPFEPQF